MRVAIIHDWLVGMRGGEKCLEKILEIVPDAEIFTLFYDEDAVSEIIKARPVHQSLLGHVRRFHRHLLPLYPFAAQQLSAKVAAAHRRKPFDLMLSISHCAAKNVVAPRGVKHLCYCLTPVRYLWDQYDVYFGNSRLEPVIRQVAKPLRSWDVRGARGVDRFIAISHFIRSRISKYYQRESDVIYPPVDSSWLTPRAEGEQGKQFLCVQALVPYKRTRLIVETFTRMSLPLTVVGSGPEEGALKALAGPTVRFESNLSEGQLAALYRDSRALVFAAEEDFGMTPVEMQAGGRPVIAYGRGGALETVCTEKGKETGVLFSEPSCDCLSAAIRTFIDRESQFTVSNCTSNAEMFSLQLFKESFQRILVELGSNLINRDAKKERAAV